MRRRPSTIAPRAKVFNELGFEEVTDIVPFTEACDTWDAWHKLVASMGLCYRQPVPHTNKQGKTMHVNMYMFMPMTPVTLDSMLAMMSPTRAEWLRGVLVRLCMVDTTQTTLDAYMVPINTGA
jgi:hypothetical protein